MASSSSEPRLKAEAAAAAAVESSEAAMANDQLLLYRGLKKSKKERGCTAKERISKMPPCGAGKRSSIYRGVTRHRWTGRYEAHLWDKSTWNQNQNKKGKQGAYDEEEAAARAYDLAALKYWGPGTLINFPVSDYSRDLEEMQNLSREEYLASLRRKSSGFTRGISKYRGLPRPSQSGRWETSFGRLGVPEYFSSIQHYGRGEGTTTGNQYPGGFCIERKIDLTSYIKWWGSNKIRQTDSLTKSLEETKHSGSEDIGNEFKALEWSIEPTEPYQMPRLGLSHGGKKHQGSAVSALSILSQSGAYKSLQEKALKEQDKNNNENKNSMEMDYGKAIQKSTSSSGGSERSGVPLGTSWLPFQRSLGPLTPYLSAPLLTNYNNIDPLADPILWTSLVSAPPTLPTQVAKTETSSKYTCFHPEE